MGVIKNLLEALKRCFGGGSAAHRPPVDRTIEIRDFHRRAARPADPPPADVPKIKIGAVHKRRPAAARDVRCDEVNVVKHSIGKGITVNKQRKPGKCPICATQGRVEANVNGGDKWICEECGSTFN